MAAHVSIPTTSVSQVTGAEILTCLEIMHITSVRHVLLIGDPDSPPFWGGDLVFVRGDVQESGGGALGFPKTDNGADGGATG